MPSAAVGSGRFGIRPRISSLSWAASACCRKAVSILADSSLSAASSSGPGLPLDAFFCSARSDSARSVHSRQSSSAASSLSKSSAAPRLSSAARYPARSCRAALRSITFVIVAPPSPHGPPINRRPHARVMTDIFWRPASHPLKLKFIDKRLAVDAAAACLPRQLGDAQQDHALDRRLWEYLKTLALYSTQTLHLCPNSTSNDRLRIRAGQDHGDSDATAVTGSGTGTEPGRPAAALPRVGLVASTEPIRIVANAASMVSVTCSPSTATPSVTAIAGLMYVITLALAGPASAISLKKIRNAAAVQTKASPAI